MIRGQPRPPAQSNPPSAASTVAIPSQPYPSRSPPAASPRPRPSSSSMNRDNDYRHHTRQNTVVPPISGRAHRNNYHGGFQPNVEPATTSSSRLYQTAGSYSDPNVASLDINSIFPSTNMSFPQSTLSPPEIGNFDHFTSTLPFTFDSQPQVASNPGPNAVQQEHVLYYFEHVRKMQFIFAGSNLVTNIIYSVKLNMCCLPYHFTETTS
jgi:C6 transcription factor Pro1